MFSSLAPLCRLARLGVGVTLLGSCATPDTTNDTAAPPAPPPEVVVLRAWTPPTWLPEGGAVSPWALQALDGPPRYDEGPELRAAASFVADLDRGEVLFAHNADLAYPVASLTKLVSALALASQDPDLDQTICVGPEQYPTRSGARSKFETGACHIGWDWLGAALVASDNRGAMGLPALAGQHYDGFLEQMAIVSEDLRMDRARWTDPSGLEVHDRATARDIARAVVAVAAHPDLWLISSAATWTIEREYGPQMLFTTNRLVDRWETLAAKTGYTDPARYCFAQVVRTDSGGTYAVVVLGAPTSSARFGDAIRLVEWADSIP